MPDQVVRSQLDALEQKNATSPVLHLPIQQIAESPHRQIALLQRESVIGLGNHAQALKRLFGRPVFFAADDQKFGTASRSSSSSCTGLILKSSDVLLEHVLCYYRGDDAYVDAYFDRKVREFFDLGVKTGGIPPFLVKNET